MNAPLRYAGYAAMGLIVGAALSSACSASDTGNSGGGGGGAGGSSASGGAGGGSASGGTGAGGQDGGGTGGGLVIDSGGDSPINADAACDLQKYEATVTKAPVDVIFVVDNSCSMGEEMKGIQDNINLNFAQIIASSGIDYRVIMIGEHGGYNTPSSYEASICIGPPLGGKPCTGVGQNTAPSNNPPVFFHYDHDDVESTDAWCKMLDWYKKPDRYNLAPNGWSEWLRKEALKTFVLVTDDAMSCKWPYTGTYPPSCSTNGTGCYTDGYTNYVTQAPLAAQAFDTDILALDPVQFGTAQNRNYVWHSLSGVVKNPNSTLGEYQPTEAIVPYSSKCTSAVNSGPGTQALSILTGGLRYPVCDGAGFDVVFKKIAEGVIKGAKIQCDFPIPAPPTGKELDPKTIQIQYTPSKGGSTETFAQVADASQCKPGAFYISGDLDAGTGDAADGGGAKLVLCTDACNKVQGDDAAKIEILALCKTGGPN
ncbi:MAG: hypothetical protein IT375_22915 [Polyangiaceae bacterium]|nr:hypothetical protein [Polyangiaceae bacterium]MCK6532494.1 hypothetical protein [Polyangiaceae bacterium]